MPTIDDVRRFWDANPLWTGEASAAPGSRDFFEQHTQAVIDMAGGKIDRRYLPVCAKDAPILDLGCGIGFWTNWLAEQGFTNVTGADLSANSLAMAQQRARLCGYKIRFDVENAEAMRFPDASFAHVNCSGVIHHSPDPAASMRDIYRVLIPGGRAVVGVYHLTLLHRLWPALRGIGTLAAKLGIGLKGRGRDALLRARSAAELVRLYDGADNPIGVGFGKRELLGIVPREACDVSIFYGAFPNRAFPKWIPRAIVRAIANALPLMIMVVFEKPHLNTLAR